MSMQSGCRSARRIAGPAYAVRGSAESRRQIRCKLIDAGVKAVQEPDGKIPDAGEFCPAEPYFFFKIRTGAQIEIVFELPHRLIGGVGEFSVRELLFRTKLAT